MGADVGGMIDGYAVCLREWVAGQDGGDEGAREGVARADGVDHLHAGRVDERLLVDGEDGAVVGAGGEDEVAQVVELHEAAAEVVHRVALQVEDAAEQL